MAERLGPTSAAVVAPRPTAVAELLLPGPVAAVERPAPGLAKAALIRFLRAPPPAWPPLSFLRPPQTSFSATGSLVFAPDVAIAARCIATSTFSRCTRLSLPSSLSIAITC